MRKQFRMGFAAAFAVLALAVVAGLGACMQVKREAPPAEEPVAAPPAAPAAKSDGQPLKALPEGISGCPGFGPEDAPIKLVAFVDNEGGLAEHANLLLTGLAGGYSGSLRVHVCELPLVKTAPPVAAVVPAASPKPEPVAADDDRQAKERQLEARKRAAARRRAAMLKEREARGKERGKERVAPPREAPGCDGNCGDGGGCRDKEAGHAHKAPAKKAGKWKPVILRSEDMEKLPTEAKGITGCARHGAFGPKVTILAFLDLSSPDRGKVGETLAALEAAGGGETATIVCVTQKPRDELSNAAARTMVAAHKMGKLAPFRAALEKTTGEVNATVFEEAATEAGLDIDAWKKEVSSKETWAEAQKQSTLAGWLSASEGPYLFINGVGVSATAPVAEVKKIFDKQLGYGKRMQNGGAPAEIMHAAMSRSAMEGKYMKYVIWGLTPSDPEPHPLYGLQRPIR